MDLREISGVRSSVLGFGCMRFPVLDDGKIDRVRAESMLDNAYAAGVTYYDTAYVYHEGQSEQFLGNAMKKYPRSSYMLATKLPVWKCKTLDDAKAFFQEQLDNLLTDYIDFYLLHAIGADRFDDTVLKLELIPYFERQQRLGRIGKLGFSFHDSLDAFKKIISYRKWDFCQLQLNYMDTETQQGLEGARIANSLGIPIIVMEPVKGGALASLPEDIAGIFKQHDQNRSLASWAMRYVADIPGVSVVLSGMSNQEQLSDNIATFSDYKPLSEEERNVIEAVASAIRSRIRNGCTGCKYCVPCPKGVNIPRIFSLVNNASMYGNIKRAKNAIAEMEASAKPSACVKCRKCEALCPQGIGIVDELEYARINYEES